LNLPKEELVFKRKISTGANGQARISLPKPIAQALGKGGDFVGLIWRGGALVVCPWPEVV